MTDKISIIVPIYKVEAYLKRCVQSVIQQTYRNLEIILVDDGSPDRCGVWIEAFAKEDSRIRPLHKENGGLSDARNVGMQAATGDYMFFLDSDDWIAPTAIETLMNQLHRFQADVVQSNFYYAYQDYLLLDDRYYGEVSPVILDNPELMRELVKNEKVKNFAWGKLYKTELIKELPFRKGVLFEDVFWAHQVMHRVHRYVILNQPLYYYFQRNDSIVAHYTSRNLDMLRGLKERHWFISMNYKDLVNESLKTLLKQTLIHYHQLLFSLEKVESRVNRRRLREDFRWIAKNVHLNKQEDWDLTQQMNLFLIHPYLQLTFLFLRKIARRAGILPKERGLKRIVINK
ncbi:glycosyltransferase [Pullulanibacillus sp. KACC 23026]|uniref:glycosyltransferase family 2 protein n=1 Tax=Pullulanibacillus sp. KACC 23026 TaxID=3028315 RepID=UPI0023B138D3|nr:glycosyltransferase [Pullulanibacillus sp. KACC 23026]WEG11510.1 glycosyltransferase [Pullulanibacillus sp. KACC 23026]